ncbi:thiamine-binding protein, partial [Sulfurihydrogenibium yellowstonense]
MSFLVEFSMFPTDKGESVSPYVSRIIKMIDESRIPYRLTPMG